MNIIYKLHTFMHTHIHTLYIQTYTFSLTRPI